MRILITGASGVVGRILTKALAQTLSLILADIREPNETDDESYLRIAARHAFAKADIYDRSALQRPVKTSNLHAVVHLAAVLGRETPWEDVLRANVVGAINVLEISLSFRVERAIYASTNNIYGGIRRI